MAHKLSQDVLAKTEVFRGLAPSALAEVALLANERTVGAGAHLFDQGQTASAFCVLLVGQLKMLQISPDGEQVVVRYIGPGEMFGTVAAFCRTDYPATALAVTDSVAATWDVASAEQLVLRYPRIASNVLRAAGQRLRDLQDRYLELATQRVERRVAHALLRLIEKGGKQADGSVRVQFPLSRQDLAEMTGTTLHTVSRILSAWESRGWIDSGRQRVAVRDASAIARIADDQDALKVMEPGG